MKTCYWQICVQYKMEACVKRFEWLKRCPLTPAGYMITQSRQTPLTASTDSRSKHLACTLWGSRNPLPLSFKELNTFFVLRTVQNPSQSNMTAVRKTVKANVKLLLYLDVMFLRIKWVILWRNHTTLLLHISQSASSLKQFLSFFSNSEQWKFNSPALPTLRR